MRTGITITVSPADHDRLSGIVSDGNSPQKHVWRAEIVLLTAEGEGTSAIMSATGKSKTAVWRWQERFMREGVEGLLHDKTRPPGTAPIEAVMVMGTPLTPPSAWQTLVALKTQPPTPKSGDVILVQASDQYNARLYRDFLDKHNYSSFIEQNYNRWPNALSLCTPSIILMDLNYHYHPSIDIV